MEECIVQKEVICEHYSFPQQEHFTYNSEHLSFRKMGEIYAGFEKLKSA